MIKTNNQDRCPRCKSDNLKYSDLICDSDFDYYFEFECLDCRATGKEWYSLEYKYTTILIKELKK